MFAALMKLMKANKILPQISDTERQALEAGTVWIDGEFFGGNPDFKQHARREPTASCRPKSRLSSTAPATSCAA